MHVRIYPTIGEVLAQQFFPFELHPDLGLLIAIGTVVFAFYRWLFRKPTRPDYSLEVLSATWGSQFDMTPNSDPSFQVLYSGTPISELHFATLYVVNTGAKTLNEKLFNEDLHIKLNHPKHVLQLQVYSDCKYAQAALLQRTDSGIGIRVLNVDAGCVLKITMLFDREDKTQPAIASLAHHIKGEKDGYSWSTLGQIEDSVLRDRGAELVLALLCGFYGMLLYVILRAGFGLQGSIPPGWMVLMACITLIMAWIHVRHIFRLKPDPTFEGPFHRWHRLALDK